MKNMTLTKTIVLSLVASAALAGCGTQQKDPLKNYSALRNDVPVRKAVVGGDKTTITTLFSIDPQDSLNFNQGEDKIIPIKVRLFFDNNEGVRYKLSLKFANPTDQATLGASLTKIDAETWGLKLHPGTNVLTPVEDTRTYNFQISFDLLDSSSPISKANMAGYEHTKDFALYLYKETDQPVIEDSDSSPIKLIPGQEVNANQDVTIQFIAAAKGLHNKNDLAIDFERGPSTPSLELAQMDGYAATELSATQGAYMGKDSSGRDRFQYSLRFSARTFADYLQKQIDANPQLKAKFARGALSAGEALFYMYAKNEYNQKKSVQRQITLKVNLTDKAGVPVFVNEAGNLNATIGNLNVEHFYIKSDSSRGDLKITAVHLGDKTELVQDASKAYTATQNGVTIKFSCNTEKPVAEIMGCKTSGCVKGCRVQVSSTCDASEGTTSLIISAESTLGASTAAADLVYKINVKGKSCSAPAPKADAPKATAAPAKAGK